MTSRERVLAALAHTEPDRVPIDISGVMDTAIHINAYERLMAYLGLKDERPTFWDEVYQVVWPREELLEKLGVDVRPLDGPPAKPLPKGADGLITDAWGMRYVKPEGGLYYDPMDPPLAGDITLKDVEDYPWPKPENMVDLERLRTRAKAIHDRGYVTVVGLPWGAFTFSAWMRGFEDFYLDLALRPEITQAMMEKFTDIKCGVSEKVLPELSPYVDIVASCDDLGMQNGLLISLETYRKMIKPHHVRYHEFVRKQAGKPVYIFFHCCGSCYDAVGDLIETGIDILNPVQVAAAKMDTRQLKKEFGNDISFWGGIDTQHVLPHGTPADVKDEVRRRIDDLAPGGGLVLATVHQIQADVPPENIVTMVEALQEYGTY